MNKPVAYLDESFGSLRYLLVSELPPNSDETNSPDTSQLSISANAETETESKLIQQDTIDNQLSDSALAFEKLVDNGTKLNKLSGTIEERQENARSISVYLLLGLLILCVFGIASFIWKILQIAPVEENISVSVQLITLVWTSVVTLVSGAIAFYFGNYKS